MKRVLLPFVLSFLFLPACLSCDKKTEPEPEPVPEPTPTPEIVTTTLSGNNVTVEEGQSASIDAVTNSSNPILFASADESVATVSSSGLVTGVKAGTTTVNLKVEAVEGKFTAAEKNVLVTVTAPAPIIPDNTPKPGVYTFTASPLKGQWEVGDQIYIQGGYGPAAQVIPLTAEQISADGVTASVDLEGDLFKYLTDPDPLYAVWPAEAVKKEDGLTGQVIEYEISDVLLTQAYLIESNFKFVDVSSFISFSVSGGFDRFIIAGTQRPGLRYSSYKNEYSSVKVTPAKPKDDGYPFREQELGADGILQAIYFPGGINFKEGFTLYFAQGDNWTAAYTYTDDINLKAGKKLELGDITSQLVPYDGGKPHMPEIVSVTKYTVNVNEFSGLCLSEDKSFLWAIDDNGKLGRIDITYNVGEVLETWSLGGDPEGISIHPETGDLIIGNEDPVAVGIVKAPVRKGDKQTTLFKIKEAKGYGNSGMEGITYYKKDGDRDLIYCGTQTNADLFLCDLNAEVDENKYTTLVTGQVSLRQRFTGVVVEIAGLSYDPQTDWLWMVDSEAHKIFVFSGDATRLLCSYSLKTRSNEEGIVVDHSRNCVWIADDYGSPSYLYKYEFSGLDDFIIAE